MLTTSHMMLLLIITIIFVYNLLSALEYCTFHANDENNNRVVKFFSRCFKKSIGLFEDCSFSEISIDQLPNLSLSRDCKREEEREGKSTQNVNPFNFVELICLRIIETACKWYCNETNKIMQMIGWWPGQMKLRSKRTHCDKFINMQIRCKCAQLCFAWFFFFSFRFSVSPENWFCECSSVSLVRSIDRLLRFDVDVV